MNREEYMNTISYIAKVKFCKTEGCKHISRDHDRSKKINGIWTGKCHVEDCDCKQYKPWMNLQAIHANAKIVFVE